MQRSKGYTLGEALLILGVIAVAVGLSVALLADLRSAYRLSNAALYLKLLIARTRVQAVKESRYLGLVFDGDGSGYWYRLYRDGNGNGIRRKDIRSGVDLPVGQNWRLSDQFSEVRFGILPIQGLMGPPVGKELIINYDDPIRLGASDILSLSPLGTSSGGTLYMVSEDRMKAVKIYGVTGRVKIWGYHAPTERWVEE